MTGDQEPDVPSSPESSHAAALQESARILLLALDVFDAAAGAVSKDLAAVAARDVVLELDEAQLRRVVVAVAVEAVWKLPPAFYVPRTAEEIHDRLGQVRRWVSRMRLEASWVAS